MKRKTRISMLSALLICCLVLFAGCGTTINEQDQNESLNKIVATDYSQSTYWLNLPEEVTKEVDVFYPAI